MGITARFLMVLENEEKRPSIDILLRLVDTLNIPGDAILHPQIQHIDSEDQQLLRQYMRLNDRDKSVIRAAIQEILYLGEEEEFYQGEIREMILDAIAEKLKNLGEKTRRWDVLTDVLNANDYQNIRDERERTVKVLFKDYKTLSASMRQQLLELGFEITEEGKHYRLTYYGDGRYKTTIAKTGSDWREGKNIASVILKSVM